MNIEGFRAVADRPNAIMVVDVKSARVKARNNHVLNRAITWLQRRFSPNPLRDAAMDAAHNRFLQAIADRRSGYDGGDVNRARELLAGDVLERRPLSSRRIREVLDDLDGRSSATTRINRKVAAYFHEHDGIANTLAARDLAAGARGEQADNAQSVYSDAVGVGPPERVDDSGDPASTSESGTAREDTLPGTLTRPSPTEGTESAAAPETPEAPAPGAQRTAEPQAETAEVETTVRQSEKPRQLSRELAKAGLPGEVAKHLKKLIGAREIVDPDGLAKHGNRRTAEWVVENRVGRWYVEALKDKGVRRLAQRDGTVSVPSSVLSAVAKSITDSPALKNYTDIKVHSRDLIAALVRQEIDPGAAVDAGAAPTESADRAQRS